MVAPTSSPTQVSSTEGSRLKDSGSFEKRRQDILLKLVKDSVELRLDGNTLFKDHLYSEAADRYSDAIHLLRKVPYEMGAPDLVKALNNRGRVYVKLAMMECAETDATEVLSLECAGNPASAAALLVRYHARVELGTIDQAVQDLKRSADLGNVDAKKQVSLMNNNSSGSSSSDNADNPNNGVTTHQNCQGSDASGPPPQSPNGKLSSTFSVKSGEGQTNGLGVEKLIARPAAGAGEELVFGGPESDSPCWGRSPLPDVDVDRPASSEEGRNGPSGAVGEGGERSMAKVLELSRWRRQQADGSGSAGNPHCCTVTTAFTATASSATAMAIEPKEKDKNGSQNVGNVFPPTPPQPPPPLHPLLEHASVKRCFSAFVAEADAAGAVDGETDDSPVGVRDGEICCGGGSGGVKAAGTAGVDGDRDPARREESVDLVEKDEGAEGGGAVARDCGNSDNSDSCDGDEDGRDGKRGSAGSEAGLTVDDVPAPAKQAQDIRWLVAQAKAKPAEGDVWAVLDLQWWLRWQRFTGCDGHKSAPGRGDGDGGRNVNDEGTGDAASDGGVHAHVEGDANGGVNADVDVNVNGGANAHADAAVNGDVNAHVDDEANGGASAHVDGNISRGVDANGGVDADAGSCSSAAERGVGFAPDSDDERGERKELTAVGDASSNDEDDGEREAGEATGVGEDPRSAINKADDQSEESAPEESAAAIATTDNAEAMEDGAIGAGEEGSGDNDGDPAVTAPVAVREKEESATQGDRCGDVLAAGNWLPPKASESQKAPAPPYPGPIDNSGLVMDEDTGGRIPGTGRRLRVRLVRGYHFVVVPQEAWKALYAWYGGGPVLPRLLVPVKDSASGIIVYEPQLYPEFSRLDPVLRPTVETWRSSHTLHANLLPEAPFAAATMAVKNGGSYRGLLANGNPTNPANPSTDSANPSDEPAIASNGPAIPSNDRANPSSDPAISTDGLKGEAESRNARAKVDMHPCSSCGRPTKFKCNSCMKNASRIFYCSKSCQAAHWRYHKGYCGRKDSEEALTLAKRGKAGLNNLGNTCFLNSAVQCLSHVQPLTRHILTDAFLVDVNTTNPLGTGGHLVRAYEQVLKDLWFGTGSSVSPFGLKNAIAKFAPQFIGYSQQDCQEVLSFLLDGLHEDLNRVFEKPYLALPDGECGRPDDVIAAEAWDMFKMRDRSVLVDNLYGQFKSTLECQECGKVSRKFDEFNVMPVELLDAQPLNVMMDFAPLLKGSAPDSHRQDGTPNAGWILGGPGLEGRRQRRIGVLLPRDALVADLKEELAIMFKIAVDEMVIVVVPETGPLFYRVLPDTAAVKDFTKEYEITAHECIPDQRYALVINRVFEGGRHLQSFDEGIETEDPLIQWMEGVRRLSKLRFVDREAPFLISFPHDLSCLGLLELVWSYMGDFLHLPEVSEAGDSFSPRLIPERAAAENGVILTEIGRFVPPTDRVFAAAVLDARGGKRQGLDFLRFEWSGLLLGKMNVARINEPFGADNHLTVLNASDLAATNTNSTHETSQRARRVSLQDCLEKFSVPETLCEDNSWYCGNCKTLRQAVKTIQVWSLPEVLIIHFKRFSHTGPSRRKVELLVDFPIDGLDMSPYCRGETLEGGRPMSALYDLFAVSNHMGAMAHGHYTAFVRDWEGGGMSSNWHMCDDHECRPMHESRVCTSHAYVLFYRRRPLT